MTIDDVHALTRTGNIELIDKAIEMFIDHDDRWSDFNSRGRAIRRAKHTATINGHLNVLKYLVGKHTVLSSYDILVAKSRSHKHIIEYINTLKGTSSYKEGDW